MGRRCFLLTNLTIMLLFAVGNAAATDRAADEKAIRALDAAWVQAAQAKDADKATAVYADDASMLPAGAPIATGKAQIHAAWAHFMSLPGYGIDFQPTKIVVSKAGDMAYDMGTTKFTMNDDKGQPMTSVGKYVVTWQKQGGQWKVVADIFNDDK